MTKTPDYLKPSEPFHGVKAFDQIGAQNVIDATGDTLAGVDASALAEDLNDAVMQYVFWKGDHDKSPTPKQRLDALKAVEKRADKLLEAFAPGEKWEELFVLNPHVFDDLREQASIQDVKRMPNDLSEASVQIEVYSLSKSIVLDACAGVGNLKRWAKSAQEQIREGKTKQASADDTLIGGQLPAIFCKYAERRFTYSRPSGGGVASGPGIDFITACLNQIGISKTPDAISSCIERQKKLARAPSE